MKLKPYLCIKCGKPFIALGKPSRPRKYCSKECRNKDRSVNFKGAKHPNWGGGRTLRQGYVLVKKPEHPDAGFRGYILEHRLVMEGIIGRRLESYENVHHKNGIKHDNRPENLELWSRPQPTGVRFVDAVLHCPTCTCCREKR